MLVVQVGAFLAGATLVAYTLFSAIETFVLPRSARNFLTRLIFRGSLRLFASVVGRLASFSDRERIMSFYAPITVIAMLPTWLALILFGYALMFWAGGTREMEEALRLSGSSLLTLGVVQPDSLWEAAIAFAEGTIGLILVALLISYLPTMYAAFSRREAAVTLLEVRAGKPPSAVAMLIHHRDTQGLDHLGEVWDTWESWFVDVGESHTSLAALVFFRSPQPDHSWVTAAGAVLDAASLALAAVEVPNDPRAGLCIRAGYIALRRICDLFDIEYDPDPQPTDPIAVTREEFDTAYADLIDRGIPVKRDREQAWRDFAGWRVRYDQTLRSLAGLTMAPPAPWSGDRPIPHVLPPVVRRRRPRRSTPVDSSGKQA